MHIRIIRKMKSTSYDYHIYKKENLRGKSRYTWGVLPLHFSVMHNNKKIVLKQTNWLLKLINSLPILNTETFTPFSFYIDGVKLGKTKKKVFAPIFYFELDKQAYTLTQYNDNIIVVIKKGEQIALYQKESITINESNIYNVNFDEKEIDMWLILLFCIFIDGTLYPNGLSLSLLKYEKHYRLRPRD